MYNNSSPKSIQDLVQYILCATYLESNSRRTHDLIVTHGLEIL